MCGRLHKADHREFSTNAEQATTSSATGSVRILRQMAKIMSDWMADDQGTHFGQRRAVIQVVRSFVRFARQYPVIPAQAGIRDFWTPAYAG